jgi:PIN domain nuclease of toxin-antitoxin system
LATIWEISIKHSLGKLIIRGSFEGICDDVVQNGFEFFADYFPSSLLSQQITVPSPRFF